MYVLKGNDLKVYLSDLASCLKIFNEKLSGVMESELKYLERASEKIGKELECHISSTGFPSAPSLRQDIESLAKISKEFTQSLDASFERLEKDDFSPGDKVKLDASFVTVAPSTLEAFLKPTVDANKATHYLIEEKNGWFYLTEQVANKEAPTNKPVGKIIYDNVDEFGFAAVAGGATVLLGPLGLLAYPALLALKSSKKENKSFLAKDVYYKFKNYNAEKDLEKSSKKEIHSYKFFHPSTDGIFTEAVLVERVQKENGNYEFIVDGTSKSGSKLEYLFKINKDLIGKLRQYTYGKAQKEKARDEEIKVSLNNKEKLLKFLGELYDNSLDLKKELYELNDEEKTELENILKQKDKDIQIQLPSRVFVDRRGTLHPSPSLWAEGGKSKTICETFGDSFTSGYLPLPLKAFVEQGLGNVRLDYTDNLSTITKNYVYVNQKQFELELPTNIENILQPSKELISIKQKLGDKIIELFKNSDYKQLKNRVGVFGHNLLLGSIQDLMDQIKTRDQLVNLGRECAKKGDHKSALQARNQAEEITKELISKYNIKDRKTKKVVEDLKSLISEEE
ncbi:hypothetical protein HY837_01650 [archaeon]|nr:hypothetical protein [archaeon]